MIDSDSDEAPLSSKLLQKPFATNGSTNGSRKNSNRSSINGDVLASPNGRRSKLVKKSYIESSDSDVPLSLKKESNNHIDSSDSDAPLISKKKESNNHIDSSDSDAPLISKKNCSSTKIKDESSDSDVPLSKKMNLVSNIKTEDTDDSDVPLSKKNGNGSTPKKISNKRKKDSTNGIQKKKKLSDSLSRPVSLKESKSKTSKSEVKNESGRIKKVKKEESEEEEERYEWWHQQREDDTVKWDTLSHNGVCFPPEYVPHGIKMKYDGIPVTLPPQAEEVAGFFAALLETDYASNPVFVKNFFKDFTEVLKKTKAVTPIKDFKKCDFTPMFEYFQDLKEKKKAMTKEEKLVLKKQKEEIDKHYGFAILDGRKEKVGNFRIEPPGLFRGRGEHPRTGCLKKRVRPEQITLNIGKEAKIPPPPPGHKWGSITHDNTVTWLATWKENVNGQIKYVMFGATSSLKGQSDMKKFDKARELKKHVASIRKTYTTDLKDPGSSVRQRATAMYLIDVLALRAGNEKGEDEADTVGCCSLRYEHITLVPPNVLHFDFLGKDSIRYVNDVNVSDQVYKNIAIFKKGKKEGDMIFDKLNTAGLNKHLSSLMPGLSAKVFRTYNASYTFQEELKKTPENATIHEKILAYNRANRQVAILCNHQRSVSKGFDSQMEKIEDKIQGMMFQRQRIKKQILLLDPKIAKKRPELVADEDLDQEWCLQHVAELMEKEREKAKLKFEKKNLELKENKEKPLPASELKETLSEINAEEKALIKEVKSGKAAEPKRAVSMEQLENRLEKITARIEIAKTSKIDKDENKTTALGTSKINYIDPRISAAWCAKHDVPIDKIFPLTLREKFKWAMEVSKDYVF